MVSLNDIRSRFAGMRSNTASEIPGLKVLIGRGWFIRMKKSGQRFRVIPYLSRGFMHNFQRLKLNM